jgi:hypothetical protein
MHLLSLHVIVAPLMASVVLCAPVVNHEPREPIATAGNPYMTIVAAGNKKDVVGRDLTATLRRDPGTIIEKRIPTPKLDSLYMIWSESQDEEPAVAKRESGSGMEKRDPIPKLDGLYMAWSKAEDEEPVVA